MYVDANGEDHVGGVLRRDVTEAGAGETSGGPIVTQEVHLRGCQVLVFENLCAVYPRTCNFFFIECPKFTALTLKSIDAGVGNTYD